MIRRIALASMLMAGALHAQSPTPSPSPSPTPSPAPKPTPAPVPPPSTRELINGLKDDELEKALQSLKSKFLDPSAIDEKASQRATLEGFVRRLSPGVVIVSDKEAPTPEPAPTFLAEIIDSHIGYFRLGSLDKNSLAQLDASLTSFGDKKIDAVILDLRGVPSGGDFEMAAEFARRFCTKGKLLFSIQKPSAKQERIFTSNQDPAFQGVLVVLTDGDTSGAAEAMAATLRLNANAMIIGSDTTGEAVEFVEEPIGGGAKLRVAVAQVILPDSGSIFPGGVKPDISISLPRDVQEEIFKRSKEKGVSQFVFETERIRMNEASLVANHNPEIENAQSAQRDRNNKPELRDTVLQRAVDLVTAIGFFRDKK